MSSHDRRRLRNDQLRLLMIALSGRNVFSPREERDNRGTYAPLPPTPEGGGGEGDISYSVRDGLNSGKTGTRNEGASAPPPPPPPTGASASAGPQRPAARPAVRREVAPAPRAVARRNTYAKPKPVRQRKRTVQRRTARGGGRAV